jgi:hypothetical protein
MKRSTIIRLAAVFLFALAIIPTTVFANQDSRCFTHTECVNIRKSGILGMSEEEAKKNPLYQGTDAINACEGKEIEVEGKSEQVGFCYPATRIETATSFGKRNTFANVGEFIQVIYQYGTIVAGILAVIVIMASGFIWLTSAGSADKIKSAKNRIGGALMGLFLMSISYLLLNTINPYLVNIRLPQTWLINPSQIAPKYCDAGTANLKLAITSNQLNSASTAAAVKQIMESNKAKGSFDIKPEKSVCGNEYFVEDTGDQVCGGTLCPQKGDKTSICYKRIDKNKKSCHVANIVGIVYNSSLLADSATGQLLTDSWEPEWANEPYIYSICTNGAYDDIQKGKTIDLPGTNHVFYSLSITNARIDNAVKSCAGKGGFRGFSLSLDMNGSFEGIDQRHWLGISGSTALDIGDSGTMDVVGKIVPKRLLISPEELKKGIRLDVPAGNIFNVDDLFGVPSTADRKKYYGKYGFK